MEALVSASLSKQAVDDETARWLTTIGDDLAEKLAAVGLDPGAEAADNHSGRVHPGIHRSPANREAQYPEELPGHGEEPAGVLRGRTAAG